MVSPDASSIRGAPQLLELVPGCYDRLSLALLYRAGLRRAYVTPFGAVAARLGASSSDPWSPYVDLVRELSSVGVELIIDAHCGVEGHRSPVDVASSLVGAGASALVVEDRTAFWSTDGDNLRPLEEMAGILRQIRDELGDGLTLIARTDALRSVGEADVVRRCVSFREAGADLVMPLLTPLMPVPDHPASRRERLALLNRISGEMDEGQLVVHSPTGEHLTLDEAQEVGAAMYLLPQYLLASRVGLETVLLDSLARRQVVGAAVLAPTLTPSPSEVAAAAGVEQWLNQRW